MTQSDATNGIVLKDADLEVELLAAGASIRSIRMAEVGHSLVLGADDRSLYGPRNRDFLGASIGRHANRIAGGRFQLGGVEHRLSLNEPSHHLHGGLTGAWAARWTLGERSEMHAAFHLDCADGEDGYPGKARLKANFTLTGGGGLRIDYGGEVDQPSLLNMTSHVYFNLGGEGSTQDHLLEIPAEAYLPVDETLIPTGEVRAVGGGRFDFRQPRRLADGPEMLDHNFCIARERAAAPRLVARLSSERDGLSVAIHSTECGLQVYDGAKFDGGTRGLTGSPIGRHGGIALEPQAWPNAPNEPDFPSTVVEAGEAYRHTILYRFERR